MSLTRWFEGKAQPKPKDTTPALKGNLFQTCDFLQPKMPMLGKFHLGAQKESDDQPGQNWTVFRVSERAENFGVENGETTIVRDTLKPDLTFIEALTYLANFESTAADTQYEAAADPGQKEALGFEHYQAFAHREGYVFDHVSGAPVKVRDGAVAGDGTFAKAEIALFRQHYDAGLGELARKTSNEAIAQAVALPEERLAWDFDPVQAALLDDLRIKKILVHRFVESVEYGRRAFLERRRRHANGENATDGSRNCMYRNLNKIDFLDTKPLMRGVLILDLFMQIEDTQFCIYDYKEAQEFERSIFVLALITQLELPTNFADELILREPDFTRTALPQPVEDFVEYCRGLKRAMDAVYEAAKRGEKTVPLENLLPVSEALLLPPPVPALPGRAP